MASRCGAVLAALLLAVTWLGVDAGCYKDKSLKKEIPQHLRYHNHKPVPLKKEHELAKNFNWCNNHGINYCVASWNQHLPYYCGACWVHGSLSMIQDRLKIKKNALGIDVMLGRQTLLNCASQEGYGNGCDGGDTWDVFRYMTEFGLPDEGCMPYNATDHTKFPGYKHCPPEAQCLNCMPVNEVDTCWPIKSPVKYYLTSWGQVDKGVDAMMSEIYHRGPITCGMACPEDFTWNYKGGIYRDTSGDTELDHDVEVVGWGEEDGLKYWLVRNSWGAYWGELGFFRVERGVNALQIESGDCWYAEPEHRIEQDVEDGKVHGSMWGLVDGDGDELDEQGVMLPRGAAAAVRARANIAAAAASRSASVEQLQEDDMAAAAKDARAKREGVAAARRMLH